MYILNMKLCFVVLFISLEVFAFAGSIDKCPSDQPTIEAPRKNIWSGITDGEIQGIIKFIQQELSEYNLTTVGKESRDNVISQIELLRPNKTEAIGFLSNGKEVPSRFASVRILFGAPEIPYYQEYMVGPLPIGQTTSVKPLTFLYNNKTPGRINVPPAYVGTDLAQFLGAVLSSMNNITQQLWNVSSDAIFPHLSTPFWEEDGKQIAWADFRNLPTTNFDSPYLLPIGLFARFDLTGRDFTKWNVTGWYYNGVFYETTDEFEKAISSPNFEKLMPNIDGPWTSTDRSGDAMRFDELPPPVPAPQGSKRFSVDYQENYITWMDFSFYVSISKDTGMRLFDIHYKGNRILYELGLEEALTHYAGSDPAQSGTTYFDTQGGFGSSIVPLVNGYDCPSYSTYLNATWVEGVNVATQPNGVCLFEMDAGFPIQRHSAPALNYTSVTKNIVFTIRSISTISNYDFLTSYNFHLDGSIEVSVRASGYIMAAYYAHNEDYGFKIHDYLSGSLHDHMLTFKADFDILGERNSIQKVHIVPATVEYPWAAGKPRNTMKLVKSFIEDESQSKINWEPNAAAIYAVVNKEKQNALGEYPGYRLRPSAGTIHSTVINSTNVLNAGEYATHDLFITKQKDTEPRAAHPNNPLEPSDPLIDFSKFFDGESLDQEDIVVWFNLGMHHVPHTGDLPNTVFSTAHSAVSIEPLNYFPADTSRATRQQIRINYADGQISSVERFGAETANCSISFPFGDL